MRQTFGAFLFCAVATALIMVWGGSAGEAQPAETIVTINSTGTPALNCSWLLNDARVLRVTTQIASIGATGKFTNGDTSIVWADWLTGCQITFTTAQFISWAAAYAQTATNLELYAVYHIGSPPTLTVTIP